MKSKSMLFMTAILTVLFVGCAKQPTMPPKTIQKVANTVPNKVNIVPASAFEKAISNKGIWNIALTKNLTIDKNLAVDGEYKNDKNIIERKIALYSQDKNKNITARFTLTIPKLTINSPNTSIEHGIFKGDLYVSAKNFQLIDTTVEGNIYFTTNEAKSTFKMDSKSKVTGKQELVTPPMISTAPAFEKAISSKGTWIIALTKNLTIDKNLAVDGEYKNDKNVIERKIALYSQDKNKNITDRFTLTIPKLTINSPNTSIEHGIFKGDLYVSAKNFQLIDTTVEGNVYFTTNEAKSTFKMDTKSKVTGKQELLSTSMVNSAPAFEKAISSKGTWNIALTKNLTIEKDLAVDGEYKNDKNVIERKIALCSQDKNNNIIDKFTLSVPKLTINSPRTTIEHGVFKGDLYVSSNNFRLMDTIVEGNVYFTTHEAKSTFKMDTKSKVTGKQEFKTQTKTTPNVGNTVSMVSTATTFENAISSKGTWIITITKNLTINKALVVDGEYKNGKKDANGKDIIERKIDLYSQDEDNKITDKFTLTIPKLTINSPLTIMEHGTFKGDLYVSSKNFRLIDAKVEGNVYFTTDEAKSTFKMDKKSIVTGKQELKK
ncbi:hypothetical protein LGK95_14685 [Clostridium algoriphilum]|uniref:hypothetical protein n=1 Tax=Clostridium algoriphilum TaxID=198347 RepID=UPI001CF59439|nr:hypothetical protein [Clostridium algoriphilum]MCB2294745.1 hypothetical protein [Clostridium algoriphilum]